ncbi:MAG: ATP-binding protein [Saprospiraceae bacterium]
MSQYPIVALTGPRQSGKTTLLKSMFPEYEYVSLENTNTRSFATDDPIGFLKKYPGHVIFDEVQQTPQLFSYLQTAVDASGQMGQFVLSGSQNFQLMERITQTLAGRVALFKLLPFDMQELRAAALLPPDWRSLLIKGFYPAVYHRNIDPAVFYANYVQTYVERDVTALLRVQDLRLFRNFIGLCAARTGQLLNVANLATECGISQPTAKAWLSLLESSYIIFLLPPYFENFSKRIVKTPKIYFYDVGLAAFLLGIRIPEDIDQSLGGILFENMIVAELFKQNYHQYQLQQYWFWRDSNGHEVDVLTKHGRSLDIFEIKSTQTVLPQYFKGLDYFDQLTGKAVTRRTLIYGGNESQERTRYAVQAWDAL